MKLREIANPKPIPNPAVGRLMSRIDFTSYPAETQAISRRLQGQGIKPSLSNIKRYLIRCLTLPLDELPAEERTIILRSGRAERFD